MVEAQNLESIRTCILQILIQIQGDKSLLKARGHMSYQQNNSGANCQGM